MTSEEFISKYGEVEVQLASYYKYTFSFSGQTEDGEELSVSVGGDADDIYRDFFKVGESRRVRDLCPVAGSCGEDKFYDY